MRRTGRRRAWPVSGLLLLSLIFSAGCVAPPVDLVNMQTACTEGLQSAIASRDKNSSKNALLYHMQLGTFQHACGHYDESTVSFENAKRIGDDLYTKSVKDEAATWLVNDYARAYPGEKFELVHLRVMNALNYVMAGRDEDALVEARQIDFMLRELNQQVGGDASYDEDAFGRFLTGMLYEEAGDIDNARISYLKALDTYQTQAGTYGVHAPLYLLESASSVAEQHSRRAVTQVASYGGNRSRTLPPGTGEVVVLHQVGRVPEKVDQFITVTWGEGWAWINEYDTGQRNADMQQVQDIATSILASDTFRVAFPKFSERPFLIDSLQMRSPEAISTSGPAIVQDISSIARQDLDDRIVRIRAKAIARAAFYFALKKALQKKMENEGQDNLAIMIEVLAQLRNFTLERSDKRQWRSLPARIQLSTMVLPAGLHTLEFDYMGRGAIVRSEIVPDVDVRAGERTFLVVRTAQ